MRYLLGKPSEILTLNELERLSFVLQHPLGGNMEDGPMDLVRYFIPGHTNSSRIYRNKKVSIVLVEAELRKHLNRTMDALFGTAANSTVQSNHHNVVQMNVNNGHRNSSSPIRSPSNSLHQEMSQLSLKDAIPSIPADHSNNA
mmetsp:Transcript_22101/g.33748  ORF Transcript_22101/g.33748 Transcript_22101/m.33748 type:complete len:143 (-) Transcript_22101:99-527(-)